MLERLQVTREKAVPTVHSERLDQGRVVRKQVNANPGLTVNRGLNN